MKSNRPSERFLLRLAPAFGTEHTRRHGPQRSRKDARPCINPATEPIVTTSTTRTNLLDVVHWFIDKLLGGHGGHIPHSVIYAARYRGRKDFPNWSWEPKARVWIKAMAVQAEICWRS